jgi:tRNA threonylcarbamoyladenosine biosynthesis protein TsaE
MMIERTVSAPLPNPPPQAGEGTNDRCASLSFPLADEAATLALARRLAGCLAPGLVVYLHGDLGAGKTTLVRGVLNALGHTGRVKSPTYTLLETYSAGGLELRHFDLYRLNDQEEWESAGFRDEFDGHNVFFIEWPEKAQGLIPAADMEIDLDIAGEGRIATLLASTKTGRECLERL